MQWWSLNEHIITKELSSTSLYFNTPLEKSYHVIIFKLITSAVNFDRKSHKPKDYQEIVLHRFPTILYLLFLCIEASIQRIIHDPISRFVQTLHAYY